ncbi:MAG TPA: NAD-dependent malic enzyme [Gemmatimonadales bacterium]|nr:NAD-dependent malic enzyme [Gemmatimonadales bacterium]
MSEASGDAPGQLPRRPHDRRVPRGVQILQDPRLNKGTAFTESDRDAYGLRGLLPPRVFTQAEQERRVLANLRRIESPLDRYLFLVALLDRNERLFYRTLIDNLGELLPVVYTPTVGEACRQFGLIFRRPRGLYVSARDRGRIPAILRNWPERNVRVVVVTDGERILGLGDLGAHGMGIPIGKLTLYTACGGLDPAWGLPVMLDVGTDNEPLRLDPNYIGLPERRLRGEAYHALLDEFMAAVEAAFPGALVQFEDFATANAFGLLGRYRTRACMFNDDIQGTAAVVLAGLVNAGRLTGIPLAMQRILFVGAGVAVGAADLITAALARTGVPEPDARARSWFFDQAGLVVRDRGALAAHLQPYAHAHATVSDLVAAIRDVRPTALVGLTGRAGVFTPPVLRAMAEINPRPIVLAMSNPTAHAECTAEAAYAATGGRVVFASGSPFGPVTWDGGRYTVAQANNAYVFPGVGLAVSACRIRRVSDAMFLAAADALAAATTSGELAAGALYPAIGRMREVSLAVAEAAAAVGYREGLAATPEPTDLGAHLGAALYEPAYPRSLPGYD